MEIDSKNEIIAYRRQKAHELLNEVQLLIDNKLWNSAVSRMYYACFHIVSALLISRDVNVKTHSGIRQAFALHCVKTRIIPVEIGRVFMKLYDKRQSSDYDDFIYFKEEEVIPMFRQVLNFVDEIDKLF